MDHETIYTSNLSSYTFFTLILLLRQNKSLSFKLTEMSILNYPSMYESLFTFQCYCEYTIKFTIEMHFAQTLFDKEFYYFEVMLCNMWMHKDAEFTIIL